MPINDRERELAKFASELAQVMRSLGGPPILLEQLDAAARGDRLPHASVLPLDSDHFTEVASARMILARVLDVVEPYARRRIAAVAGATTSQRKAAAARANGRKGGRPRKVR